MTPRMFDLLLKRYVERMKREDRRAGIKWENEEEELVAESDDEMFNAMMMLKQSMEGAKPLT